MAEGRMLKKIISTSKKLANLKSDSARLLYTWLLPHLDVEGRFSADPNIVKGYVVPRLKMSTKKIAEYLDDMVINGLIILYEKNSDKYLQLNKFKDFQILRENRELIVKPIRLKGSGVISSLTRSDGIVEIPKDQEGLKKGNLVLVKLHPK